MRNIRARRRFKALLVILLAVSFIAFFESRIEAFAPQFKVLTEGRIKENFGRKIDISIGALKGGLISPFTLHDVKILRKDGGPSSGLVQIGSITSNYRIWNFIFPDLLSARPYITVDFLTKNGDLSGFVVLGVNAEDTSLKGYIRLFGGDKINIYGNIKNGLAHLILMPNEGFIKIDGNFAADGVLLLKIIASHVKFECFDITGEVDIKNIVQGECLEGGIEAKNLVLNYKPFNDIRASYRVANQTLELKDLDLGGICYINGRFGLTQPHIVDAVAVTDNTSLDQTLVIFNPRYASLVQGTMNSRWELKGPLAKLKSKIHLEIRRGRIIDMKFEFLSADLKGDGPIITIDDSRITRESGSFTLSGYMDMTRIGKESLFEKLKIISGENAVIWDGYETLSWQDVREFRLRKNIVEGVDIGFKKFINDEKIDESIRERDEYELSYKLHPNDSIKLKFSDNKSFFGLEHKDKF